jgi:hypothetical protein
MMHGGRPFEKYAALVKVTLFMREVNNRMVASFQFGLIVVTKEPLGIYIT